MQATIQSEGKTSRPSVRFRLLMVTLGVIMLLLAGRLFEIQALRADAFLKADGAASTSVADMGRGSVTDVQGLLLAVDSFYWELGGDGSALSNEETRRQVAVCLEDLLELPASDIVRRVEDELEGTLTSGDGTDEQGGARQPPAYVVIGRGIDRKTAALINGGIEGLGKVEHEAFAAEQPATEDLLVLAEASAGCEWPMEGLVWASPYRVRYYPQQELFAHLLGFVMLDRRSFYGVEESYQAFLQGHVGPGVHRSAQGMLAPNFSLYLPSDVGHDIILTVDWRIQRLVAEALEDAIELTGSEAGTVIVLNPKTGAILASASVPSYNPNRYWEYSDGDSRFSDPATGRIYEPGSVFKIFTIGAGIDSGTITADSIFEDPGRLEVADHVFQNADRQAHGQVTATDILALSLNVGVAQVGERMGADVFYKYVSRFGFGRKTNVDLAHESDGLVRFPRDPGWNQADFIANTFGQAISVTPLQLLAAVAAVANDGVLMQPHVVDKLVTAGRVIDVEPVLVNRVISAKAAQTVTAMMVAAVERGAPEALIPGYSVAGKTGTAQVPIEGRYHEEWTIASFAGYAPAEDPAFACLIKLDKPQSSIWGARVAAPLFAEIAPGILQILRVAPVGADQ